MASDGITPRRPASPDVVMARPLDHLVHDEDDGAGPASDERILALLCHLGGLFTWIVMPLVLWVVKKAESPFIDHHGKEAINFQLFLTLPYFLILGAASVVAIAGVTGEMDSATAILWGVVCTGLFGALTVYEIVVAIVATIAAARGKLFRYPCTLRLIR
jgi:uncharacterized Tic20 family protein